MVNKHCTVLVLSILLALSLMACGGKFTLTTPEQSDDGWQTGSPADVGLDQNKLSNLMNRIESEEYPHVHSVLIVKNGKLVLEEYFDGYRFNYSAEGFRGEPVSYDAQTTHNTMSVTKAVIAALVGIAIDNGLVAGVNEKVYDYFPNYEHLQDGGKEQLHIEHLLTMTSGLQWNEWDVPLTDVENDLVQLFIVDDPVGYILSKDTVHEPGTYWYYSGGDVNLLGELFKEATGIRIDDFSDKHLFAPLGITDYEWQYLKPEIVYASGELYLRPRDMAKFGYLYLNDGKWNDKQILSEEWVENSIETYIPIHGRSQDGEGYGYQWWQKNYSYDSKTVEAIVRTGWGGQAIILFPSLDTLVVFTGGNYSGDEVIHDMVTDYILPSVLD